MLLMLAGKVVPLPGHGSVGGTAAGKQSQAANAGRTGAQRLASCLRAGIAGTLLFDHRHASLHAPSYGRYLRRPRDRTHVLSTSNSTAAGSAQSASERMRSRRQQRSLRGGAGFASHSPTGACLTKKDRIHQRISSRAPCPAVREEAVAEQQVPTGVMSHE